MTQRITSQMVGASTLATIDNDLNEVDNTQQQLSTGFAINQPSDDPYGEALSLSLSGQIAAYSSYTSNINNGISWVQTASSSLQSIQSVLQTVQEMAVEGANGTMNATDLKDAAQEVLQYIGQIKQTADTQYDGSYIFSGSATQTEPYDESPMGSDAYNGNAGAINRTIGPGVTIPVNADLHGVLGDGVSGDGGLLSTLRSVYNDLTQTAAGSQTDLSNQITALQANLGSLEQVEASVGATQDRLQMAATRITALQTTDKNELGNVEDTDMADATIKFSTEQAGYQAALQSTAEIVQTSLIKFLDS